MCHITWSKNLRKIERKHQNIVHQGLPKWFVPLIATDEVVVATKSHGVSNSLSTATISLRLSIKLSQIFFIIS